MKKGRCSSPLFLFYEGLPAVGAGLGMVAFFEIECDKTDTGNFSTVIYQFGQVGFRAG